MKTASIFLILLFGAVIFGIWYSTRKKLPQIREISALKGIEEGIGRCAEMGRPLHFSLGMGGVTGDTAPQSMAGLSILSYTARLCAKAGVRIQIFACVSQIVAIDQDILMTGYTEGGAPGMFSLDMVQFVGQNMYALMAASVGYILRERPAANFLFGATYGEIPTIGGVGAAAGCFTVSGTGRTAQQGFIVTISDYAMLGEELFAACAFIEKSPRDLGAIFGEDICKFICLCIVVLTAVLASMGSKLYSQILSW